ncbi:MAG: hypothetical protein ACNA7X_03120 [Dehalococcoidia bacterium]
MFGRGKVEVRIQKTHYAPGDIISGDVILALKKPVRAREASVSLIGERITTQTSVGMGGGQTSINTQQQRARVYDFKQQLDGEKEYGPGQEYHFEMKIPADILSVSPGMQEVEGKMGQAMKVAQTAAALTGRLPSQRVKWYLLAKLDVPRGLDVSRKVDVTIG